MYTMKPFKYVLAVLLLGAILAPATGLSQPYGMQMGGWNEGMMMQRGMMGGGMGMMGDYATTPGMMGGMGMMGSGGMMGHPAMLGLSADQQNKLRRIQRETRRQHWANMGKLMDAQEDLQELLAADKPDAAAIGRAYARVVELERPIAEAHRRAMNEMRALLTDEQKERVGSGPRGYGTMDGMGRGMMR